MTKEDRALAELLTSTDDRVEAAQEFFAKRTSLGRLKEAIHLLIGGNPAEADKKLRKKDRDCWNNLVLATKDMEPMHREAVLEAVSNLLHDSILDLIWRKKDLPRA